MKTNKRGHEEVIELNNKKVKVGRLVESFSVIPSSEIVRYLKNKEIYLPNFVHKALLRKNIAPIIANAENDDKFSDEMKYRLKWFDHFTIFQLEKLTENYSITVDVKEYKRDFWDVLIQNRNELGINTLEFVKLQNLTMKYQREAQENYETLQKNMAGIFFEPPGHFEGAPLDKAREVLTNAMTLSDLRELGKKHGTEVPRRLNKKQLIDIITLKLDLNETETERLSKRSVLELERYAKEHNVPISSELKKHEMVEYILLKKNPFAVPVNERNAKVFEGINIEDHLYDAKFEEIAHRYKDSRKKRLKFLRVLVIVLIVLLIGGAAIYFELL